MSLRDIGSRTLRCRCASWLCLNRMRIRAAKARSRKQPPPKSPIRSLPFVTSGFSRPWRSRAAKSAPRNSSVALTSTLRNVPPSTPTARDLCEDPRVDLCTEILRQGVVRLRLRGVSMLPSLWPGDLLTIEGTSHDEIIPGDLVLVMRHNLFFVHRLVETRRGPCGLSWITRGDALLHNDFPVDRSELLGRVVEICRAERTFVPDRKMSMLDSVLASIFCRFDRIRSLALRIHAARPRRGSAKSGDGAENACGVTCLPQISQSSGSRG